MRKLLDTVEVPMTSGKLCFHLSYAVPDLSKSAFQNYGYGLLIGSKAAKEGDLRAWSLRLTPDNLPAKGWSRTEMMTKAQALKAAEDYAGKTRRQMEQGLFAAIKYTTNFGFEIYLAEKGLSTTDLQYAAALSFDSADRIFRAATPNDFEPLYEGDEIIMVTMMDCTRATYGMKPKHRHFRFEELEKQQKKAS